MPEHHRPHPVEESLPVRGPEKDDREVLDLAGLCEGQRLEELIEGAQAAGEDDESTRVLDEHVLAHEEVAELHAEVDVLVQLLLAGELDVAADRQAACLMAAAVDRLHHPGATAGDDREATAREGCPKVAAGLVDGLVRFRARRAEDGYSGPDIVQGVEALDKLRQDA